MQSNQNAQEITYKAIEDMVISEIKKHIDIQSNTETKSNLNNKFPVISNLKYLWNEIQFKIKIKNMINLSPQQNIELLDRIIKKVNEISTTNLSDKSTISIEKNFPKKNPDNYLKKTKMVNKPLNEMLEKESVLNYLKKIKKQEVILNKLITWRYRILKIIKSTFTIKDNKNLFMENALDTKIPIRNNQEKHKNYTFLEKIKNKIPSLYKKNEETNKGNTRLK